MTFTLNKRRPTNQHGKRAAQRTVTGRSVPIAPLFEVCISFLGTHRMRSACTSVLFCGLTFLTVGCKDAPSCFKHPIAQICPRSWQVSASNNVITLRRDVPVWIMGKVNNPPSEPGESIADYFKSAGDEIHYELRLRFVPLLSQAEYQRLKAARAEAAVNFSKGASGKSEYDKWQVHYEQCQIRTFFTKHYSIFVDRWADRGTTFGHRIEPRFIDVYPPDAASEIEDLIKSCGKVFSEYPDSGT
jgi:hypothetical protein